ncbi:MAG: aspartate aminotransferase family protein [Solirubrobacterales bacterium]
MFALWHPFADMSKVGGHELVIARGEGAWVFDEDGKRYLDASAALWYCNAGHGREAFAEAARAQMADLAGYQIFDVFANRPALDLAERVRQIGPLGPESAVFFTSGGSDSIDTAAKMARRYWALAGEPARRIIISREGAYHGVNGFGTSLSGIEANASGWGPLVSEVIQVPRDDLSSLDRTLVEHRGRVAAFMGEPVQGAAGVYPPPPDYWEGVQALCREHDVLLIADEVVTGFGRVGRWFASQRYGIEPDLVTCAKGLSSGYLPIGAVLAGPRVLGALWSDGAGVFRHGYTYSGHPAACAVALANIDAIEDERLIERVNQLEPQLEGELGALAPHPLVEEVRVAGLLSGVELSATARVAEPQLVERVVIGARERGVLVRNLLGATLQISPPLVIEPSQLEFLTSTLRETLDDIVAGR